ncbi:MAG: hypothetical protein QOI47_325 [Actinomycetota bacterium]|nr:hypothetical protein [Actinomycetota bacterium]
MSYFAADSVLRRVDRENVLLLGGGRAILMQLAHPLVAQGVAEHSDFSTDPFGRLRRTLDVTHRVVFGTDAEADRALAALRTVHEGVRGPGYAASDPALLLWVHATLVDTALRVYGRFVAPLSVDECERYYADAVVLGELFGTPRDEQPPTYDAFRAYVRGMVGSLEVSDTARAVAREVLHPRLPVIAEPVLELGRQLTAGLLPRPLREQYGFSWDRPRKAALIAATIASRAVHKISLHLNTHRVSGCSEIS